MLVKFSDNTSEWIRMSSLKRTAGEMLREYCSKHPDLRKLPCLVYAQENLTHKDQRYLSMCISLFILFFLPSYLVLFTFILFLSSALKTLNTSYNKNFIK
ncbi:hypothetical protein AWRI1499_4820 [Brettanomyces bruxellensis AWRI1499]|nr:hypothetical protein AWRI1499_4820 [Brettanomyces bruxellensis AWRI1499]